ncbi:hypothetical protein [Streptomyces atratus]|uniref:hypothetical protein n=1 Tax=Streptomyces atratus TaxID=1893 RepID=UPI0035291571
MAARRGHLEPRLRFRDCLARRPQHHRCPLSGPHHRAPHLHHHRRRPHPRHRGRAVARSWHPCRVDGP